MITVTLFTKDPCPLCDHVKAHLTALAETYPLSLEEIDITQDHATFVRYRYEIPVVLIGEQTLKAPIHQIDLMRALQRAGT